VVNDQDVAAAVAKALHATLAPKGYSADQIVDLASDLRMDAFVDTFGDVDHDKVSRFTSSLTGSGQPAPQPMARGPVVTGHAVPAAGWKPGDDARAHLAKRGIHLDDGRPVSGGERRAELSADLEHATFTTADLRHVPGGHAVAQAAARRGNASAARALADDARARAHASRVAREQAVAQAQASRGRRF
jgi:hypothetical protein